MRLVNSGTFSTISTCGCWSDHSSRASDCRMGIRVWCVALGLLLASGAVRAESDVMELDSDSFSDGVAGKDIILVEFYAPWCVSGGRRVG